MLIIKLLYNIKILNKVIGIYIAIFLIVEGHFLREEDIIN